MRLSAHDEHGIRLLLRIARGEENVCLTTAALAEREGMSMSHAGKVLRMLRQGGFVTASRGNCGGYTLARPAEEIAVGAVLATLGGRLYADGAPSATPPETPLCTGSVDCAAKALWQMVQYRLDDLLDGLTLSQLIGEGERTAVALRGVVSPGMT